MCLDSEPENQQYGRGKHIIKPNPKFLINNPPEPTKNTSRTKGTGSVGKEGPEPQGNGKGKGKGAGKGKGKGKGAGKGKGKGTGKGKGKGKAKEGEEEEEGGEEGEDDSESLDQRVVRMVRFTLCHS